MTKIGHRLRSTRTLTALIAVVATAAIYALPAVAQPTPTPVVGVLDQTIIQRDSLAFKGINLEVEKYRNQYQKEAKNEEDTFRQEEAEIRQQQNVVAPDVFEQRAQDFQRKLQDYGQRIKDREDALGAAVQIAARQVQQQLLQITGEVAQQRGINIVVSRSQILLSDPAFDITPPVLELLNERLPSVEFPNPDELIARARQQAGNAQ